MAMALMSVVWRRQKPLQHPIRPGFFVCLAMTRAAIFRLLRPRVIPQTNRSSLRHQHRDHLVAVAAIDEKIIIQGENDGVFVQFGEADEAGVGE